MKPVPEKNGLTLVGLLETTSKVGF